MAKFMDKMMDMMKLNDYEDEEEIDIHLEENPPAEESQRSSKTFKSFAGGRQQGNHSANVVNFQTSVKMEVVVIQPESYDEAQDICDHIKSQRPVIINLENLERSIAQRIMDFVSGSIYTLNGNVQRVTNNIFIIAPENIDVAGDFREELKTNGIILPWNND